MCAQPLAPAVSGRLNRSEDNLLLKEVDMTKSYKGWTNQETWFVNLWLNNEQYSYQALCEAMKLRSVHKQAKRLEKEVQFTLKGCLNEASLWNDLLDLSLSRVNWLEIVENQD